MRVLFFVALRILSSISASPAQTETSVPVEPAPPVVFNDEKPEIEEEE